MSHGNEDTYREMLRIKRSVAATFSTSVNFAAAHRAGQAGAAATAAVMSANDMAALEAEAKKKGLLNFVKSGDAAPAPAAAGNADEIALDDDDDDDDDDDEEDGKAKKKSKEGEDDDDEEDDDAGGKMEVVEQKAVPDEVFGGVTDEALGARARFRNKKN